MSEDQSDRYEFVSVSSSAIQKIGWDKQLGVMLVQFKNSPLYSYPAPREIYEQFKVAKSKGQFFQANIKDVYSFERLDN